MLSDRVGIGYLATLLGTPGQDHHVLRLMIGVAPPSSARSKAQAVLDREAVTSYRSRVKELSALIAASGSDPDGMAEQREELDAIRSVLRAATGQDGRPGTFPRTRNGPAPRCARHWSAPSRRFGQSSRCWGPTSKRR